MKPVLKKSPGATMASLQRAFWPLAVTGAVSLSGLSQVEMLPRADVNVSEKERRIVEAYQIEAISARHVPRRA